ncbi:unnamed protein product [Spirodela intermedia]|uniref:Uncharacterized protein n=1 Tax=Spirodela intermedia TaxID=51605 RepID=A0A7I8IEA5_SPIIN|nr:unnamed protein product [Spirodela intermedia]CAA6655161.1 unnamed protein product [Spirodela intermedia]
MKNAAKCDTWCELQNPANHRIFERKLRPRPSGRGHACLGVTPPAGRPCARARARRAEALGPPRGAPRRVVGVSVHRRRGRRPSSGRERRREKGRNPGASAARPPRGGPAAVGPRPQVRRGHPPSLSI